MCRRLVSQAIHLHYAKIRTVAGTTEVCLEYCPSLDLTFIHYEQVFDRVETNAILPAIIDQRVDLSLVRTLPVC